MCACVQSLVFLFENVTHTHTQTQCAHKHKHRHTQTHTRTHYCCLSREQRDMLSALDRTKRSVDPKDLEKIDEFTRSFGMDA